MNACFVFRRLGSRPWFSRLTGLERSLAEEDGARVAEAYAALVQALVAAGHDSLAAAAVDALEEGEEALAVPQGRLGRGLRLAAQLDLEALQERLARDWHCECEAASGRRLPPLRELSGAPPRHSEAESLLSLPNDELLDALVARYSKQGVGVLSRYTAFRWRGSELEGVARPAAARLEELIGLERQLERLVDNVERFLSGSRALHTLLYGPRGSGKSTAVRSLLERYGSGGLRLVEVQPEELHSLAELGERLRCGPHRYIAFIDDLSFETGDAGYHPLKTLLEGSLVEQPENVLLMATSNRRHLLRERFSDRPLPEDDDVRGWDTSHERLALADRFGLVITFPDADQRRYLTLVRELAVARGVEMPTAELDSEAIRFADWGNGYSGRTARQFVDTLL